MKGWSFNALVKALKAAAFMDVGQVAGTVCAGDDPRFAGRLINKFKYGASLTNTLSPVPGAKWYRVRIGAGGGSGGSCPSTNSSNTGYETGGGGAGGQVEVWIPASLITSDITVTIGRGGLNGGNTASSGEDSKFGDLISCGGGKGGGAVFWNANTVAQLVVGGSGGTNTISPSIVDDNIVINTTGIAGGNGFKLQLDQLGGDGGPSILGSGGKGTGNSTPTNDAKSPSAGGGGGANVGPNGAARPGGKGANGFCIVEVYS